MTPNPYTNDILQWRDSLSRMPDHHFFELLRMYLGDIKTPYNKQNLIEQLSAFLRHEENKNNIVMLLSPTDILILASIDALPNPTQDKLIQFFEFDFSVSELYERLMNLEERLLLFRVYKDEMASTFKINPLLRSVINPLLTENILIPPAQVIEEDELFKSSISHKTRTNNEPRLSSPLLAGWVSFTFLHGDLCKASGEFKKKTVSQIHDIFPQIKNTEFFLYLTKALHNLHLFRLSEGEYKPDLKNLRSFASMNEEAQFSYICAAACGRCSRDILHIKAQLVCDLLACIGKKSFTKPVLVRAAYLQLQKKGTARETKRKSNRFTAMLQKQNTARPVDKKENLQEGNNLQNLHNLISIMNILGLIQCIGKNDARNNVYSCASWITEIQQTKDSSLENNLEPNIIPGSVVINAGFSVTILHKLSFLKLLDITECMEIQRLDGIAEYKITRNSCMRCFDTGKNPDDIIKNLLPTIAHEIPQNLQFLLDDWYKNYSSATLYKGYVLRIDPEKEGSIKNIPQISKRIREKLAPGVYLIDFMSDEEASSIINKAGLDYVGAVKNMSYESNSVSFPLVCFPHHSASKEKNQNEIQEFSSNNNSKNFKESDVINFLDSLKVKLTAFKFESEQTEGLLSRINRKIIVNETQLRSESVRPEKNEASGMDFLGKIHVVEHGIVSKSFLQITVSKSAAIDGNTDFLGIPLSIEKQNDDALVRLKLEKSSEIVILSIGQAQKIKRIRGSIFKEQKY